MLPGLVFALVGMLLNSVAGLLQSAASQRSTKRQPLIVQPGYLAGLAMDGLGWAATVVALRHLPVFAVQAILGGSIAVTVLATKVLYGATLRTLDRVAIGCCLAGLVLVAASAGTERPAAATTAALWVLFVASLLMAVAVLGLWNGGRAWPLALIAGLGFGGTSLAVHAVHVPDLGSGGGLIALLTQPTMYLVVFFWLIGLSSFTRALQVGTLARVTAVFQVTEVVVPGIVGIVLLSDPVRSGWWVPMTLGLILAVIGVMVLARLPVSQPKEPSRVC